jgi:hypothetical protein
MATGRNTHLVLKMVNTTDRGSKLIVIVVTVYKQTYRLCINCVHVLPKALIETGTYTRRGHLEISE